MHEPGVQRVLDQVEAELAKQENPFLYLIELGNALEQTRLHLKTAQVRK